MTEPTQSESDEFQVELEELSEPLEVLQSPEPLSCGASLEGSDDTFNIAALLESKATVNLYEATFRGDQKAWLWETQDATCAERLRNEYAVLAAIKCSMFPQAFSCFEQDGRTYFATDPAGGSTMADALESKESSPAQFISLLTQIAYALTQLHLQGYAHLALRPAAVLLGKPVRLTDFAHATRFGEVPRGRFYFAGYSAPELLTDRPVDPRPDIYSIGAMLFQAVSGYPISESGPTLTGWEPETVIAGVPQILHKCLGPADSRYATMAELHGDLLRLLRRCASQVRYEIASATTIGLEPTRSVNQDAYGFSSMQAQAEDESRSWAAIVVADGMGGMAAGEVASTVAVNTVLTEATSALSRGQGLDAKDQTELTTGWVREANDRVCDAMDSKKARGGCTLACALLVDRRLTVAHVGDCRIYLIRNGLIQSLTRDHSVAMGLVLKGELDISELRTYPGRSNVTRSLGERKKLPSHYVDTLVETTGKETMELEVGDVLLLCSDGLWEPVLEDAVVQVLAESGALNAVADGLIALALRHGAPDNATVSLLRLSESSQV